MPSNRFSRALALGVIVVAAFNLVASLSLPEQVRRPGVLTVVAVTVLLAAHAGLYWSEERATRRFGLIPYVGAQAALVFIVTLLGGLVPIGTALYIAFTANTILVAGARWGALPVTLGAILLFGANAVAASSLYQGATAGLLLTATGIATHAVATLLKRRTEAAPAEPSAAAPGLPRSGPPAPAGANGAGGLTARELEVLRALAGGARSSRIAADMGIAERTVKAHLANIYQKLGVDSRSAAVAAALQRKLI
jgi:DNA-binding CsgD family transcriptional regulator